MALVEMAQVPEAFVEVTVCSSEGQCSLVGRRQRVLYKKVMQENGVASLGEFPVRPTELLARLERGEEAWVPDLHSSDDSADEGPVKPTLKRLPKGGMWWGRYRSPATYPSSDSTNSDDESESEAEEEKPQRGGQRLMVFRRNLLATSRGNGSQNLKLKDTCKNGTQLKKPPQSQVSKSLVKEGTTAENHRNGCPDCGQSFRSKLSLSNHQRKHTREKPYRCSRCGEQFVNKKVFAAHQMSHAEEKGYKHPRSMKTATKHPEKKPYKCTQCEKSFMVKSLFVQHEKIHSKERPYKCSHCGKAFTRKEHLNRHLQIHRRQKSDTSLKTVKVARVEGSPAAPKKKPPVDTEKTVAANTRHQRISINRYKCQFCGRCMRAKTLLVDHERSHREERRYKCSLCSKSFYHKRYLEKHKQIHLRRQPDGGSPEKMEWPSANGPPSDSADSHTEENPSKSSVHRKIITRSVHLAQHLKLQTKKKVFKCQYCGKCMSTHTSFISHNRTHRGKRPYKCHNCGKSFCQKYHLDRHVVTHANDKPLKHSKSVRRLTVKSSLFVPGGSSTGQKPFKGLIQERIITRSSLFTRQPKIHTEKERYKCKFCGKVMQTKNSVLIHEKTHKGDKPYTCLECGKRFSQKNYLSCHQRRHMRKKSYKCLDSEKSLTTKNAPLGCGSPQKRKPPYLCLKCGKSFDKKYYFMRHQKTHSGTRTFKCATCGKGFIHTWNLKRHERIHLKERNHKQPAEPEESQLFPSAVNESSKRKDRRYHPVNINKQKPSRKGEISPSGSKEIKMELLVALKGFEVGVSHDPQQGEMPSEVGTEPQALLSRKNKRKHLQNNRNSIGQLQQVKRCQAGKGNARLQNKQNESVLGQPVQPTKCSKKVNLQSLKNEKAPAVQPLEPQANSVRKSKRETQLAGKQCKSCFCQQEEPGTALGKKPKNSLTGIREKTKPADSTEHQTFPRLPENSAENSCQEIQASNELKNTAVQNLGKASANRHLTALVTPFKIVGKLTSQRKARASDNRRERTAAQEPGTSAAEKKITVTQGRSAKLPFKHVCTKCQKSFRSRVTLVSHEKQHTVHRPFQCTVCSKSFYASQALNTHMRIHTGVKPYKCSQCPFLCNVGSNLIRHKRTHAWQRTPSLLPL